MLSAILLAAGLSSRMQAGNKLLLPLEGKNIFQHTMDNLLAAKVEEIVVVLGHEADKLSPYIPQDKRVQLTTNLDYQSGMTSSIQSGVEQAREGSDGFMICLADMPFIEPSEYDLLERQFAESKVKVKRPIVIPTFEGKRGNPVIFDRFYRDTILSHKEPEGCKGIVEAYQKDVIEVPLSAAIQRDLDTDADFKRLG